MDLTRVTSLGEKKYTQLFLALIMHKIAKQSCVLKLGFTTCHGMSKFTGERPSGSMMLTYSVCFGMQEEEQEAQCCPVCRLLVCAYEYTGSICVCNF